MPHGTTIVSVERRFEPPLGPWPSAVVFHPEALLDLSHTDQTVDRMPAPRRGAVGLVAALIAHLPLAVLPEHGHDALGDRLGRCWPAGTFTVPPSGAAPRAKAESYREICARLHAPPIHALAFEISSAGARAAREAGLAVVALRSSREAIDADLVIAGLDDAALPYYLGLVD